MRPCILIPISLLILFFGEKCYPSDVPFLPQQTLLEKEIFWDNKDWSWYRTNIPFFECPDPEIQTTYYYRWELLTKHLTYGSPNSGYSFTEFIDRPFWSGAYGAISCPAGHQLYEARWLRDPRYARDYSRYWFRTPGAQPRNYSTWLADAIWAVQQVHPDVQFLKDLLPDLIKNYEEWEKRYFVPEMGLFWQNGHDDGMEFNINSRQTQDILRGAPGFRPTINAYMWADAMAISRVAELTKDEPKAALYRKKAATIQENLQKKLWDPRRKFFFPMYLRDEEANGFKIKAKTLTYESGQFAGSEYGRELIGYIPWQFNMLDPDRGFEIAWKKLLDSDGFAAPFGPCTVERKDPMFLLKTSCCWWSGQSWPYATSQTLKAMANLLQNGKQQVIKPDDYVNLLKTFAKTHRKNGKPYLAEACHPDTGSFEGHDAYNHSEHYFHSSFNDLVITGLVGLIPRNDEILEVKPLAPAEWDYFALDSVPYRGHTIGIVWDRKGNRYKLGQGFHLISDGVVVASRNDIGTLTTKLSTAIAKPVSTTAVNYAVNNDGNYYPRLQATWTGPNSSVSKMIDGNKWYHRDPSNRWTCEGSPNPEDAITIDLGKPRKVHTVQLYFLEDEKGILPPKRFDLLTWDGTKWVPIQGQKRSLEKPTGHTANVVQFPEQDLQKIRVIFYHTPDGKTGLTELEIWGDARLPVDQAPPPLGNIAYNGGDKPFPRASASFSDRFGGKPHLAIDGKTNFLPTPTNRWTCYESPNDSDWVEIDFGEEKMFNRLELGIYDDRGGVQPPRNYEIESWNGTRWQIINNTRKNPEKPTGSQFNEVTFPSIRASKVRIVFTHAGKARSGVTEIMVWQD